jgi:hypothetical protein
MRLLVANVLQLVAIFDPYRCCKMQQRRLTLAFYL